MYEKSMTISILVLEFTCSISRQWSNYLHTLTLWLFQRLQFLHDSMETFSSTFTCDVCPQAKQHRLLFPRSHINTNSIFELIHVDYGALIILLLTKVIEISKRLLMIIVELPGHISPAPKAMVFQS